MLSKKLITQLTWTLCADTSAMISRQSKCSRHDGMISMRMESTTSPHNPKLPAATQVDAGEMGGIAHARTQAYKTFDQC
jgi:hypothetical protein